MKKYLLPITVTAVMVTNSCITGRSTKEMEDEVVKLKNEVAAAAAEQERAAASRAALEVELARIRALYEETKRALALRDELRRELEQYRAVAAAPGSTAEYPAVAGETSSGQLRAEEVTTRPRPEPAKPYSSYGSPPTGTETKRGTKYTGPKKVHFVKKGECLYLIAGYPQYYGNPEAWPVIYEANADRIKDPHWIFIGQRLEIPVGVR